MKRFIHILTVLLAIFVLASCQKYEVVGPKEQVEDVSAKRIILITDEVQQSEMDANRSESGLDSRSQIIIDEGDNDTITDDDDDDDDSAETQDKAASN